MAPVHEHFAWPGDSDLDCDLHDVIVDTVTRWDNSFVVSFIGGHGRWIDPLTGQMSEVHLVPQMIHAFGLIDAAPEALVNQIEDALVGWRDARTPLRLLAAPGRHDLLMEDEDSMLPLPRPGRSRISGLSS